MIKDIFLNRLVEYILRNTKMINGSLFFFSIFSFFFRLVTRLTDFRKIKKIECGDREKENTPPFVFKISTKKKN